MNNSQIELCPNPLVQYLNKPAKDFTKSDIIKYVEESNIKMINFRYVAGDGRLKTLNFIIQNKKHLDTFLSTGERVDGSNLFSHIGTGSSDLYALPRFKTSFVNPFSEIPTLDILCSYFDKNGDLMCNDPRNIMIKAHESLKKTTTFSFEVMGELEYYVIFEKDTLFPTTNQRGYHESTPYCKWEHIRTEAMQAIAQIGGSIKYGHSEVGNFSIGDINYEQNEIEFIPTDIEDAADQLIIGKWVLRMIAYKYGVNITFAPKISVGKAGSGLHIHTRLTKDGKNMMIEKEQLSNIAKRVIAGYINLAPSLTAFGNTIPTSYFRLVPHQEAPTNICWGDRNRSVLVRVPLGWTNINNMLQTINSLEQTDNQDYSNKQTVEFRCPDGSADIYLLIAGLTVAARHGLEMKDAIALAEKTYVDVNIFQDEHKAKCKTLEQLPISCYESAEKLEKQSEIYKKYNVFSQEIIDSIVERLRSYNDNGLLQKLERNHEELLKIVNKYIHCG